MMSKKHIFIMALFTTCFFRVTANTAEAGNLVPLNLFNIGDSIGEGEAADGTIGQMHHDTVWSTGYNPNDIVYSLKSVLKISVQQSTTKTMLPETPLLTIQ